MAEDFPHPAQLPPPQPEDIKHDHLPPSIGQTGPFVEDDIDRTITRAEARALREQLGIGRFATSQAAAEQVMDTEAPESAETRKENRAKALFAPVEAATDEDANIDDGYLSFIYGSDEEYSNHAKDPAKIQSTPEAMKEAGRKWRAKVTEQSLKEAEPNYRTIRSDPVIRDAIREYVDRTGSYQDGEVMAGIRTDPVLRLAVGKRILEKAGNSPYAVRFGGMSKAPSSRGYEDVADGMTSVENVALLTLAMSDGTFKSAEADHVVKDRWGTNVVGLHREAAVNLLKNFNVNKQ